MVVDEVGGYRRHLCPVRGWVSEVVEVVVVVQRSYEEGEGFLEFGDLLFRQ